MWGTEKRYQWQAGHLYGGEQGTADVSVQRHTPRQQPSAHAHADNEDKALAVKTHTGRKDDMEGRKESTGWLGSFKEREQMRGL